MKKYFSIGSILVLALGMLVFNAPTAFAAFGTTTTLYSISTPLTTGQSGVSFSGVIKSGSVGISGRTVELHYDTSCPSGDNENAGTLIQTVTTTAGGSFSGTFTAPSSADTYKFWAYHVGDHSYQKSVSSCQTIVVHDTTPPTLSFTNDVASGPVMSDFIAISFGDATVEKYGYVASAGICTTSVNISGFSNYTGGFSITDESKNGKFICAYGEDASHNKAVVVSAHPINIDITPPTATVAYSTTAPTNQNVTATITLSEPGIITNNGGSNAYVFSANGLFTFNLRDLAGNTGSATATVSNIDKIAPTITITNPDTNPAQSKTVTAFTTEGTLTMSNTTGTTGSVCGSSLVFSDYSNQTFISESDNGTKICYKAVDVATNTTYNMSNAIAGIDRTAPVASIDYSTTAPTNQNVTATITLSDGTVTNNDGSNSYIFSANGSFTFEFTDSAGNTGSATATVSNIDTTAPSSSVTSPSVDSYLRGTIVISADVSDAGSGVAKVEFWHSSSPVGEKIGESTIGSPYSIAWDTTSVADGSHNLWVTACDNVGNCADSSSISVTVDNTAPVIIINPDNPTILHVGGTYIEEGAKIDAVSGDTNIDGTLVGDPVSNVDTSTAGVYTVTYSATDSAGNTASITRGVVVMGSSGGGGIRGDINETPTGGTTGGTGSNNGGGSSGNEGSNGGGNSGNGNENGGNGLAIIPLTPPAPTGEVLGAENFKFNIDLKFGMKINDVLELQNRLTTEGFFHGKTTGYFGSATRTAVKAYQKANPPLKIDGRVGPVTRAVLNK